MPSIRPPKAATADMEPLGFFGFRPGRGDPPRVGGVNGLVWGDSGGTGGVGTDGV